MLTEAQSEFIAQFQKGELPADLEAKDICTQDDHILLANLLKAAELTSSTSEAYRLVNQGAVKIDEEKVGDAKQRIPVGATHVIRVGKRRIAKVSVIRES